MTPSKIDLLVNRFNNSSDLTEAEHTSIRNTNRFSYVHFNGRDFKEGFNGIKHTFIVNNNQKKVLIRLSENWNIDASNIGIELFGFIQIKLYESFKLFFEFKDSSIVKISEDEILYFVLKNFLIRQNDNMASEEEIMLELKKYFPFRHIKFKDLDRTLILPRLCAGLNESRKYYFFYNDGTINDISLLERKMSMQNFLAYLETNLEGNFSLMSVARIYYMMYRNFKVHALIVKWHDMYRYNLNFEIKGNNSNVIFEKFMYGSLKNAFEMKNEFIEISNQMQELYRDNSLLWLMQNVFHSIDENNHLNRLKIRHVIAEKKISIYGLSNLILLIPFVFKNLFERFDEIICYGSDHVYTLIKYKNRFQIKLGKL